VVFVGRRLAASLGAGVFVVDRAEHAVGGMPPLAVVVIDPDGNRERASSRVWKWLSRNNSHFKVELNDSATALSCAAFVPR
jgi:hypothetical protein